MNEPAKQSRNEQMKEQNQKNTYKLCNSSQRIQSSDQKSQKSGEDPGDEGFLGMYPG